MADQDTAARYRANLQREIDGAALCRALSDAETDPDLKRVYRRLAGIKVAHAVFWRRSLMALGGAAPEAPAEAPRPEWPVRRWASARSESAS